jgi:tetratricopeptide (TPR) repeat protein
LHSNLAEIYLHRAESLLTQGDAQSALAAVEEARKHNPGEKALTELSAQIHQQLGFDAAAANRWDEAQSHWQAAVELDSGSFRLAYNLALAYEKSDQHLLAGQTWREALRRRPRRADHQRAAECYRKAGEFDEVGRTYQQAIKWAPENVNLRLALAESLMTDGRLQAARNELERVLERDPKNIPALLRLGEAYFRDEGSPWYVKGRAKSLWENALQIEPKNSQALQLMGEWYLDQGEIAYTWEDYERAIEDYEKSLEFRPKDIQTLIYLAECYIELEDKSRGEECVSRAIALATKFDDYASIIVFCLEAEYDERAWEVTAQAEARFGKVPIDFFVAMAEELLKAGRKSAALAWLQRAIEKALPEESVLVLIGEMALNIDSPLSKEYLEKALEAKQMPGQAHLLLGIPKMAIWPTG